MSSHTILLVQPTRKPEGRTYSDYESVNDCMEVIQPKNLGYEYRTRNFIKYLGCLQNLRGAFETIESIISTNYLRH